MRHFLRVFALIAASACLEAAVFAADPQAPEPGPSGSPAASSGGDVTRPKPLDGVNLQAVETYVNPKTNELSFGIGIYPFDAYYYGLSINAGYTVHFSRNFAWELINAAYFFSFQKGLTTELADRYGVNPATISSLSYIFTSDVNYVLTYGKFVLLENYIRYFRTSAFVGGGASRLSTDTSVVSSAVGAFGLKFEIFTHESFSWRFEVRDNLAFSGMDNYLTFVLGTGLSF